MRAEGISFRHAVELLREDHLPLAARSGGKPPRISDRAETARAGEPRCRRPRAAISQVVSYYNETLKTTPEALKYLEGRGLKSSEMIDRFQLGFANRTLGYRLPARTVWPARSCAGGCRSWASTARAGTNTSTARW